MIFKKTTGVKATEMQKRRVGFLEEEKERKKLLGVSKNLRDNTLNIPPAYFFDFDKGHKGHSSVAALIRRGCRF